MPAAQSFHHSLGSGQQPLREDEVVIGAWFFLIQRRVLCAVEKIEGPFVTPCLQHHCGRRQAFALALELLNRLRLGVPPVEIHTPNAHLGGSGLACKLVG